MIAEKVSKTLQGVDDDGYVTVMSDLHSQGFVLGADWTDEWQADFPCTQEAFHHAEWYVFVDHSLLIMVQSLAADGPTAHLLAGAAPAALVAELEGSPVTIH